MRITILLFAAALLAGCSSFLSKEMVHAPNHKVKINEQNDPSEVALKFHGVDQQFRVSVGPPPPEAPPQASLHVWVVDPKVEEHAQPRGTVMLLHGIADDKFLLLGKAKDFAKHGYRAVLVDLRGHGRSSGDYDTYGVIEKHDLSQVIDDLERRGLLAGKLGVWGVSYGAATAIELAGHDERVAAVVAVAGFSSMREAVPPFAKTFLPVPALFISDEKFDAMIDEAGEIASFDPDEASAERAIARTRAPVLIVHGKWDRIVPPDNAERLYAAAHENCELLLVDGHGHVTIWLDPSGIVKKRATEWFDRWLNDGRDDDDVKARDALGTARIDHFNSDS